MNRGKRKFHFGRFLLLLLFLSAFCFGAFKLASFMITDQREARALRQLAEAKAAAASVSAPPATAPPSPEAKPPEESSPPRSILPQYVELHEQNPDLFGWLTIEGTKIDYPVMRTPDRPDFYIDRGFEGEPSVSGLLFVEEQCPVDGSYYLIYGHHMANGSMFGNLPDYYRADYGAEHALIRFDTLYEQREYVLMAAFYARIYGEQERGGFRYYEYADLSDEETFNNFVREVKQAAIYDTGVDAEYGDELLALSTCYYHTHDGRFVIVAKRVA